MARRGRLARGSGALLGILLGGAIIVATQFPLAYSSATVVLHTSAFKVVTERSTTLAWPAGATAAVSVPSLEVFAHSPGQRVQPIASLTKMMTAYVGITKLPLAVGETGPCLVVTPADYQLYKHDVATGQSNVKVVTGTRLCELNILDGMFVHSANNFTQLLVQLVHENVKQYVATMNETAVQLGMVHTHYGDISGISKDSTSTAADQLLLVNALMRSPLIQSIVRQTSVVIPGAGVVTTYTPLLGVDGVVGVKSGFTDLAGGCDVMALERSRGGINFLTFAVVLGVHGGDVLLQAGDDAYNLAVSAANQVVGSTYHSGQVVGTLGWRGSTTSVMLGETTSAIFWQHTPQLGVSIAPYAGTQDAVNSSALATAPRQLWDWGALPNTWTDQYTGSSPIPGGTVIGDVRFAGDTNVFLVLYTHTTVARPAWWDGLL